MNNYLPEAGKPPPNRGPRSLAAPLTILALALVCAWGVTTWNTSMLADRARKWVSAVESNWRTRPLTRQPLAGEARAGNAWEAYDRARAAGGLIPETLSEPLFDPDADVERLRNPAHRAHLEEAVNWILEGAQRTDIAPALSFEELFASASEPDQSPATASNVMCAIAAFEFAERGERTPEQRVDFALALMTCGYDFDAFGTLLHMACGQAIAAAALEELSEATLVALPQSALDRLAAGLATLDARIPEVCAAIAFDPALVAASVMATVDGADGNEPDRGFLAGVVELESQVGEVLEAPEHPWSARRDALAAIVERSRDSTDVVRALTPSYLDFSRRYRTQIGEIRMLRMAVEWHRDRPFPALTDPLGEGPLRVQHSKDTPPTLRGGGDGSSEAETALARELLPRVR